jgi:hypothetical protein
MNVNHDRHHQEVSAMTLVEKSAIPTNEVVDETGDDTKLRWGAAIMAAAGVGFIGYAAIFFARNFTGSFLELGIGPHEVDVDRDAIKEFSPSLFHYVSHLHIAVAGFIAACGVAVAALAWYGVRRRLLWAWTTGVIVPVLGLAVALPAHYPNDFDTVGHLGLIYADTALFIVGALLALPALGRTAERKEQ